MAKPSHNRAFQAYNSDNYQNKPTMKKPTLITSIDESSILESIPYSPMKTTTEMSITSSPTQTTRDSFTKSIPLTSKRRISTASLGPFLPNRKGLPMTALATKRQNLWMSIAKNNPTNNTESSTTSITPMPPQTSLLRKKILRLLLVFSYLVSISLFAIALATFYGFFWSGYSVPKSESTITNSNNEPSTSFAISQKSNFTLHFDQILSSNEG